MQALRVSILSAYLIIIECFTGVYVIKKLSELHKWNSSDQDATEFCILPKTSNAHLPITRMRNRDQYRKSIRGVSGLARNTNTKHHGLYQILNSSYKRKAKETALVQQMATRLS